MGGHCYLVETVQIAVTVERDYSKETLTSQSQQALNVRGIFLVILLRKPFVALIQSDNQYIYAIFFITRFDSKILSELGTVYVCVQCSLECVFWLLKRQE